MEWVDWIYSRLLQSFETYKKARVKFSPKLLIELAKTIFLDRILLTLQHLGTSEITSLFLTNSHHPRYTNLWAMAVHNIVLLTQRGRLKCSSRKETQIEMHTAYYLGVLYRRFQNGSFDKNLIENLDEIHFTVNMDNGKALGFRGDTSVKYVDVVAGGEAMTMVVRISSGRGSNLEVPVIIFTNGNSNYLIRGLEDSISGVSYRTGPKEWIDQFIFS